MAKVFLYMVGFVVLTWQANCQNTGGKLSMGKLEKCPGETSDIADFRLYKNDKGDMAFDMTVEYDEDIDSSYNVEYNLEVFKNGEWTSFRESTETWCTMVSFFTHPWNQLKLEIKPPLPNEGDECEIPGGNYALENFQVKSEDAFQVIYVLGAGKFKGTIKVFVENDGAREDLICGYTEFEVKL